MATKGLANLHYAIMTTEDTATTAATYSTPKRLVGINSVSIQPNNETATLYGDNKALATVTNTKEYTINLDLADLPLEDEAALLGHTYESDTMIVKGNDTPPYVAIMFDIDTHHDNEKEYRKYYKGKFAPSNQDVNTRGETTEFAVRALEATFVARNNDDKVVDIEVTTDVAVATSWYASV